MINFYCLYSKDAFLIKNYLNSVKCDEYINFMEISNKLTKNDPYSIEPTDEIINQYLMRTLEKSFKNLKLKNIYYVISECDIEIIKNLKSYIFSLTEKEIQFILCIENTDLPKRIESLFDKVVKIKNAKTQNI